jgi:hypothetical protein
MDAAPKVFAEAGERDMEKKATDERIPPRPSAKPETVLHGTKIQTASRIVLATKLNRPILIARTVI